MVTLQHLWELSERCPSPKGHAPAGETAVTDVGQETSGSDPRARGRAYVGFALGPRASTG